MNTLIFASLAGTLLGWLMGFLSVFLILLVLVQRGRGGGLTGALGGPGGQSAFGSKAGDTFTVITIVVASIWGFTCAFTMWLLGTHAPSTAMPTTVKAGPGDEIEESEATGIVIPKPTGTSGGSGLSGLSDPGSTTTPGETPSVELVPKESSENASEESTDKASGEGSQQPAAGESTSDSDAGTTAEPESAESKSNEQQLSPDEKSPSPDQSSESSPPDQEAADGKSASATDAGEN